MNAKFDNIVRQRIYQRVPLEQLREAGIYEFYVAGNSLNKQPPNDIDIFPVTKLFTIEQASNLGDVVCSTKNAITVKVNLDKTINHQTVDGQNEIEVGGKTITVQLCNYLHENIEKLVNSFDFSHIQIGAKVSNMRDIEVYYTEEYENAKMCQSTEYVGSEYPLSSLIRAFKYAKRGDFAGNSHIFSVFKVLTDVVHRGFDDFDDFKDQLDAIDLGLVPENPRELADAGIVSEQQAGLDFSSEGMNVLNKLMNILIIGRKAICKDPKISYEYAEVLGERFEQGEDAIAKDAKLSFDYAQKILKGRFEKGEDAIAKDAALSFHYADKVLKGRFEKGENSMTENTFMMQQYSMLFDILPEELHNRMVAFAMDEDYYAKSYLSRVKNSVRKTA
jgi:hypothetical protein